MFVFLKIKRFNEFFLSPSPPPLLSPPTFIPPISPYLHGKSCVRLESVMRKKTSELSTAVNLTLNKSIKKNKTTFINIINIIINILKSSSEMPFFYFDVFQPLRDLFSILNKVLSPIWRIWLPLSVEKVSQKNKGETQS